MSIRLEHVEKRYEGQPVVDGVSLDIAQGELFVMLGPSGSGKSTLLRSIAGLVELDHGRVHLFDRDVTDVPPKERGIGFVFQNYGLFAHMTVADNVEFALRVRKVARKERRARREELLQLVGLAGLAARFPTQLSGGQQQRVALARALAHEPRVLLLDEPFGALDAKIRLELREALRTIQRELHLTTVFVTHDQEEAFALSDRLAVLRNGRLIEVGSPQELYLRPRSPFVATFLGAANLVVGESTERGVRLGDVELALATRSTPSAARGRAQVLVRPEDVIVGGGSGEGRTRLGRAVVERCTTVAGQERLRLSLAPLAGVRSVAPLPTFGRSDIEIDAHRPLHEALDAPLARGSEVDVFVRRFHVIAPAGLRLLVDVGEQPAARAANALGRALAARVGAHLTEVDHDLARTRLAESPRATEDVAFETENSSEGFDVAVLGLDPSEQLAPIDWSRLARHHVLLVSQPCELPRRLLVCVTPREHGKDDVRFAERLAWQLGARATVVTVVRGEERGADGSAPAHVDRFLRACQAVLEARGVAARSKVLFGEPLEQIRAELATGEHDLVVVGAPPSTQHSSAPRESASGLVPSFLTRPPDVPVLVVRR
jgi:sulfate transport system ATP-binding protein